MRSVVFLIAGLALAAAGCGNETSPGGGSTDDRLRDRTFLSTSITENGKPRALAPRTKVRLQFTADGRLIADAGCNSMQSPVTTSGGTLTVEDLATTEMGCDAARHAQDEWLHKVLRAKPSWQVEGDRLTVTSATTTLVLTDATEPTLPLDGTRWTLNSLIQGDSVSHQAGMEKAYLEFADGKVTGSTGCNSLTGPATVNGNNLQVGPIGLTRRACAGDAAKLEQAMVKVLKGTVTFTIDGSQLTLRGAGGSGLELTGKP
ncbi:META domain-containing protein [Kribbella deserti]|uniref:META domain-containing protein n=1 Tax=Kribbella deserti TaxID=1926257 RepID=A0ABV6QXT8_9ACTN